MKQVKKYPAPQISEAVFRGRNSLYNFEVYPMNVKFNEVPAVYIISRRKIDRHGKGHHFLVCIGQTESLVEDIKKHKRGKCVKQLQADTVSVILEDDEQKRLEVENDIKAAHTIPCRREAAGAEFVFQPLEKIVPQPQRNVKTESKETARRARKTEAAPAKLPKKPAQKQPEAKAEIEVSKPKKAKRNPVENIAKADSGTIRRTPKKPDVEKKPSALKSKKTVQTDEKTVEAKDKRKIQKAKTQKSEASKAKETSAKNGKIKAGKKSPAKKEAGVSQPKKINRTEAKIEKKQPPAKTVPALKKSSGNQIKPKPESKIAASKTKSVAQKINKAGAQKIDKANAGKLKINKTNTVGTPDKTASAKSAMKVKDLKTKAGNKTKTGNKAKNKIKISAGAKVKPPQTGKTKASADLKTAKPSEINRQTKASKSGKTEKANQEAKAKPPLRAKAKGKTEAPKSAKPPRRTSGGSNASPKVKANTKPETGIKSSVKGKENRLKSSPGKRLAF
jgi:hypothetical protein